jgi:WhiB family redox-sensing transcriptional regulator
VSSGSYFGKGAESWEYPDFADPKKGPPSCQGKNVELFFVDPSEPEFRESTAEAKSLCKQCPYVAECLEWAIKNNEMGVWGGTTERERASLKRRGLRPWNLYRDF